MEFVRVDAQRRTGTGKSAARKLRREGLVPGVAYGLDRQPQAVAVRREVVERLERLGHAVLLELYVDGEPPGQGIAAILKEVQRHPVTWEPLSIDLQWVSLAQEVEVTVPVVAVGEARGVKAGGILEQLVHELTVRCLPTAVPPHIEVDVSQMEIGDTLHVSDISPPEGVAILEAPNTAVVHVAAPRVAEELAAAAEAGAELAEGGEAVGADEGPSEEQ